VGTGPTELSSFTFQVLVYCFPIILAVAELTKVLRLPLVFFYGTGPTELVFLSFRVHICSFFREFGMVCSTFLTGASRLPCAKGLVVCASGTGTFLAKLLLTVCILVVGRQDGSLRGAVLAYFHCIEPLGVCDKVPVLCDVDTLGLPLRFDGKRLCN